MAKQDLTGKAKTVAPVPAGEAAADAIRAVVARIPAGQVSSYGEVAARAGLPGRARLIGKVLGKTPDGVALPWFRVLRSDGRIAFSPQSRPYREQRARLIGEGVRVERGRVDLARFGWERNLDFALWAPPPGDAARDAPAARKIATTHAGAKKAGAATVRTSKTVTKTADAEKAGTRKANAGRSGETQSRASKAAAAPKRRTAR